MAFNTTFQKNKRFWMAAILMICIVSFVFCGMPQINDNLLSTIFGRSGDNVATIGGKRVTSKQLHALKTQRELADHLMKFCVTEAFNKISKTLVEEQKKVPEKDIAKRREALTQLQAMRESLAYRKSRPFYFESGRKFDDLTEFMLWQAQADHLGIHLEREHIDFLYQMEFFKQLSDQEIRAAEIDAQRTFHGTSQNAILKAIGEEFRVRIAQYAVMQAQPYSFFSRSKKADEGYTFKFTEPEVPDEVRAPMTLAQLWDVYKKERAEFDVTLLPVRVEDFAKKVADPTDIEKATYFKQHNKPFDPASPNRGVEMPSRIQIAYVYADPASPAYLNQAKAKSLLEVTSPLFFSPMDSSVALAARYTFAAEAEMKAHLQRHYEALSRSKGDRYIAPSITAGAGLSNMAAFYSNQSPQAAAGIIAGSLLSPEGSLASYVAWGATKHQAEIDAGNRAFLAEHVLNYAGLIPASPFNQPLELAAETYVLGLLGRSRSELPVAVVAAEIRDMVARRQAEEWARSNMQIVKKELEGATGDAEKFKRVLNKLVPELKLTNGPPGEAKNTFYHRYAMEKAEELKPLKESFEKYVDMINLFEGRDLKPETLLRPTDFYKMFFDSAESFAASSQYRAMTWPPAVQPNKARAYKKANPRLINQQNINPEIQQEFNQAMLQNDPRGNAPSFDLFNNAEKPILFWRVSETEPVRPAEYRKIDEDLKSIHDHLKAIDQEMKKAGNNPALLASLKDRANKLKFTENDLVEISNKITAGWKFEQARAEIALPKAKEIAEALIKADNSPNVLFKEAKALGQEVIPLTKLSRMYPERLPNFDTDYFDYPLPKAPFANDYPRDDMAKQLVELYDLKAPIDIRDADADKAKKDLFTAELDKANKDLYDLVKGMKNPEGKYVQILTNKPRSVFYIAVVTEAAKADRQAFMGALTAAPFERRFARDHFVTRAQQMEGKQMRAAMVRYLGDTLGYSIETTKVRDDFDKVSSD